MKKYLIRAGWILLILFCLGAIFPAYVIIMEWENESQGQIFSDFYTFDPKDIFTNYKKGEDNLFSTILLDDLSDEVLEGLPEYPPSKRNQQDYLETLNIFHETVLHKPFTKNIRRATFSIPKCSQVSFGPQSAVIFTASVTFPRVTYYSYYVDLKDGSVRWHGNSYESIISWPISALNLSKNKVTAEQALQIAEEQGGEKVRLVNHNQCDIDIDIDSSHRLGNWVVTYNSTIDEFTSLLTVEIDANTGRHRILAKGGAGYYSFDVQQIRKSISEGKMEIFKQIVQLEDNLNLAPVSWTQEDYYKIAKAFNREVLNEDLNDWKIHSISFELDCDDASFGPQEMYFTFWRLSPLEGKYFVQDVVINPRTGILKWNIEYDYDVSSLKLMRWKREIIDKSWIKIPAEEALNTVYEEEGKKLHVALKNSGKRCKMNGLLMDFTGSEDANSLEWNIGEWKENYEALGEQPAQLTAFVHIETGKLRFFRFYGNLEH